MSYQSDRTSYGQAERVNFTRGVVPRISPDGTELWLGLPIYFTAYDPPGGVEQATVRVRGSNRTVGRWGDAFDQFKWQFINSIHGFWDRKFYLERTGTQGASAREGVLSMGLGNITQRVIARFHPYEVTSRDHAKTAPLCFKVTTADSQQTSSCHFFGAYNASADQLPAGASASGRYSSVLDSADMDVRHLTTSVGSQTITSDQYPAHHETGHHLGLMHRCTNRSLGSDAGTSLGNWYPAHRRFSHPTAQQDRRSGDDYCDGSNNEAAIRDVMAKGDVLHPWHAGLWLDVVQHVAVSGRRYGAYTWHAGLIT